jgi:hypothetical protein
LCLVEIKSASVGVVVGMGIAVGLVGVVGLVVLVKFNKLLPNILSKI